MAIKNLLSGFHNNNYGLQGGSKDQYYHFSKADHESLLALMGTVVMDDGNLILSNDKQLRLRDSGQAVWSSAANTLDITSTTTLNLKIGGTTKASLTSDGLLFNEDVKLYFDDEYSYIVNDGDGFIQLVGFEGVVVDGPAGLKLLNYDDPGSDIYLLPAAGNLSLSLSAVSKTFSVVHNSTTMLQTSDDGVTLKSTVTIEGSTDDGSTDVQKWLDSNSDPVARLNTAGTLFIVKDIYTGNDANGLFMGSAIVKETADFYLYLYGAAGVQVACDMDVAGLVRCNSFRIDQATVSGTITPDRTVTINCDGTNYKIPVVAA